MSSSGPPHDASHMRRALALARLSRPSPNPRVGAVIVKEGSIVGEGYHEQPGKPHAEILALRTAGDAARGADLYVTLEPCCHVGRTGPCTEALSVAGIRRVFIGMQDPDPRVNGNGALCLRNQGIEVFSGIEEDACQALLRGYRHQRQTGRPLVTLKAAITLDGFLATTTGHSKWISSPPSRRLVHEMRAEADAVLIGVGTALADDPLLTVRDVGGVSPLRLVLDPRLRTPLSSQLVLSARQAPVLLVHGAAADPSRVAALQQAGVELQECPTDDAGRIDLAALLDELGRRGVLSLLVEGGATVHGAFVQQGLAQRVALFIAPRILGAGLSWAAFRGTPDVSAASLVRPWEARRVGDDLLLEGELPTQAAVAPEAPTFDASPQ